MRCEAFDEMLDRLMDDDISASEREAMKAHALECPDCARRFNETLQLKSILAEMPEEVDVPLKAQAAWRAAVRAEASRNRMKRVYRYGSIAAAVIVLAVGIGIGFGRNAMPGGEDHMVNAPQEMVSTDVAVNAQTDAEQATLQGAAASDEVLAMGAIDEPEEVPAMAQSVEAPLPVPAMTSAPTQAPAAMENILQESSGAQTPLATDTPTQAPAAMKESLQDIDEAPMGYASASSDAVDMAQKESMTEGSAEASRPALFQSTASEEAYMAPAIASQAAAVVNQGDNDVDVFADEMMLEDEAGMIMAAESESLEDAFVAVDGIEDLEESKAAGTTAPMQEMTMTVADVDEALDVISDALLEYEGVADIQKNESGDVNLYITLPGENLSDFLNAISHLDVGGGDFRAQEAADAEQSSLLLVLRPLPQP